MGEFELVPAHAEEPACTSFTYCAVYTVNDRHYEFYPQDFQVVPRSGKLFFRGLPTRLDPYSKNSPFYIRIKVDYTALGSTFSVFSEFAALTITNPCF